MDFGFMLGQCCILLMLFASSGRRFSSIDFALFLGLMFNEFLDLAENFLRNPNSSKNTSHDSLKAGGVTPWREESISMDINIIHKYIYIYIYIII